MVKVIIPFCILALCAVCYGIKGPPTENLHRLIKSRRSGRQPVPDTWASLDDTREYSPVYIGSQEGLAKLDKIVTLPGQPEGDDFSQYSGYVTVDPSPTNGKSLFYYFAESPQNSSTKPLVLWLDSPVCSSLIGGMADVGPFRVNSDGRTLFRNMHSWTNIANVLFFDPPGTGFSYSNSSSVYNTTGDKSTANDAYTFLVNWLERFPQYKTRDFYITGERYAGHCAPQLAYTILTNNKKTNQTVINLKGIAIGNPYIDDPTSSQGRYDYWWTHALYADETHEGIKKYCDFKNDSLTDECGRFLEKAFDEIGNISYTNIYAPTCLVPQATNGSTGSVNSIDPCWELYLGLKSYLNLAELQKTFHAKLPTTWEPCAYGSFNNWTDSPSTVLPIIEYLIANGQRVWIYSGDVDGVFPVTAVRYAINALELPIQKAWRPWYLNKEVGGYVVEYKGLVFTTIRGAGHTASIYQPERALTMFSSFLQGKLPPAE